MRSGEMAQREEQKGLRTKPPFRQNQWVGGGAVLVAKSNRFRGVRTVVGAGRDGFEVALRLRVESPGPA